MAETRRVEVVHIHRWASPEIGVSRWERLLTRLGDLMAGHRTAILSLQWTVVAFYVFLVLVPAFLPHPSADARLFSGDWGASSVLDPNYCATTPAGETSHAALRAQAVRPVLWHERLVLLAQYLFWGIWWPFVILSIMFAGRFWCGVLCPEGALAEFASRHGRGGTIPKWLRWPGWPPVAFVMTTIYGQLISVYDYPQAALLILGGSTVAAVVIGFLYGRGKRVWCRYLCPVSGVFSLLARLAPVHFKVDREAWSRYPHRTSAVDCAPLLNVRRLQGMAQCHACGRCSGHRDAVTLALRSPAAEILGGEAPTTREAVLLLFGMLGVAMGAFQWTVSPWFVAMKQAAAEWLVAHEILWPLNESPAWWLLTRHPEANDVFTWLDGAAILAWIGSAALVLGGGTLLAVRGAACLGRTDWRRLALGLVPIAGLGLFLGLSMMTANHLRAEGVTLAWLPYVRAALLATALGWSALLGNRVLLAGEVSRLRRAGAMGAWLAGLALVGLNWWAVFFVWS